MTTRPVYFEDYRVNDQIKALTDVVDERGEVTMRRGTCGTVRTSILSRGGNKLLYIATDDGREVRVTLPALIRPVRRKRVNVSDLFGRPA